MKNCPICGGELHKETKEGKISYKGKILTFEMKGDYCEVCGEGFHDDSEQTKITNSILLAKRAADELLTPKDIKRIRLKAKLTQVEAQYIFGGGVNAFSKYERAEVTQPRSTDVLLRLLDNKQISVEQLQQLRKSS